VVQFRRSTDPVASRAGPVRRRMRYRFPGGVLLALLLVAADHPAIVVPGAPAHCLSTVLVPAPKAACTTQEPATLALNGAQTLDGWCRIDCLPTGALWRIQIDHTAFRGKATCTAGILNVTVAFVDPPVPEVPEVEVGWTDLFSPFGPPVLHAGRFEGAPDGSVRTHVLGPVRDKLASDQTCGDPWGRLARAREAMGLPALE